MGTCLCTQNTADSYVFQRSKKAKSRSSFNLIRTELDSKSIKIRGEKVFHYIKISNGELDRTLIKYARVINIKINRSSPGLRFLSKNLKRIDLTHEGNFVLKNYSYFTNMTTLFFKNPLPKDSYVSWLQPSLSWLKNLKSISNFMLHHKEYHILKKIKGLDEFLADVYNIQKTSGKLNKLLDFKYALYSLDAFVDFNFSHLRGAMLKQLKALRFRMTEKNLEFFQDKNVISQLPNLSEVIVRAEQNIVGRWTQLSKLSSIRKLSINVQADDLEKLTVMASNLITLQELEIIAETLIIGNKKIEEYERDLKTFGLLESLSIEYDEFKLDQEEALIKCTEVLVTRLSMFMKNLQINGKMVLHGFSYRNILEKISELTNLKKLSILADPLNSNFISARRALKLESLSLGCITEIENLTNSLSFIDLDWIRNFNLYLHLNNSKQIIAKLSEGMQEMINLESLEIGWNTTLDIEAFHHILQELLKLDRIRKITIYITTIAIDEIEVSLLFEYLEHKPNSLELIRISSDDHYIIWKKGKGYNYDL